ncbi:glycosyltransferase [Actinoplanes sp. CA-051413]|uniref:glycosyltransferase n=1 Tax=Actinoplanes sp. CA-051413 TaxID=3239899 RepID=UPI003D99C328
MTASERRPRLLYLAFYFPPSRASGVYRARATANHFTRAGWDVTVFAAPLGFLYDVIGSTDEKLMDTVDPRITVERPELDTFRWEHELQNMSWFRGTMPTVSKKFFEWREAKQFPEQYVSWARSSVSRALKLHRREKFDAVLATGNPFSAFAAGWAIGKLAKIPYVIDYRDSWTLDLFKDEPAYPPRHPTWKWERRVIGKSAATVFVNNALRDWHAERYPQAADRMMVVPNGWDPDLLELPSAESVETTAPQRPLKFGYLGTVTTHQPVEEMAEAFRIARTHPDLAEAELNIFGHLGFFRHSHSSFLPRLGLDAAGRIDPATDAGLRLRGPVSKTEVSTVYADSDVLVFLAAGGRYVTSGKIFEYMATGRPIVSVHAPDIAAREVLEGYPLWFHADSLDPEKLAQSFIEAGQAAREAGPEVREAARRHAETFQRDTLLEPLETRMRAFVRSSTVQELSS